MDFFDKISDIKLKNRNGTYVYNATAGTARNITTSTVSIKIIPNTVSKTNTDIAVIQPSLPVLCSLDTEIISDIAM